MLRVDISLKECYWSCLQCSRQYSDSHYEKYCWFTSKLNYLLFCLFNSWKNWFKEFIILLGFLFLLYFENQEKMITFNSECLLDFDSFREICYLDSLILNNQFWVQISYWCYLTWNEFPAKSMKRNTKLVKIN